jgi:hypothetical protein
MSSLRKTPISGSASPGLATATAERAKRIGVLPIQTFTAFGSGTKRGVGVRGRTFSCEWALIVA